MHNKSIKVFDRLYQLFKLFGCLSNKKIALKQPIFDLSSKPLHYLHSFGLLLSFNLAGPQHFLNFLVAHCPALIRKNVWKTGISKFCYQKKFPFSFIQYNINFICTKFVTFTVICAIVPKGWCRPLYYVYLMPVQSQLATVMLWAWFHWRSESPCLISYVNYRGTCKVYNLSLFVTQFRLRVGRFVSSLAFSPYP